MRFKVMKIVFFMMAVAIFMSSCTGWRYVLCTSNGILTYDRHTGKLEILWEHKSSPVIYPADSVQVLK